MKHYLKLSCTFKFNKNLKNIFDYQNNDNKISKEEAQEDIYFCKGKYNKIFLVKNHNDIKHEYEVLFKSRFSKKYNQYELINPLRKNMDNTLDNIENLNNKLWLVLKSEDVELYENTNKEYYLMENDIIKLGKKKYEIIKKNIVFESDENDKNSIYYKNKEHGPVMNIILKNNKYITNSPLDIVTEDTESLTIDNKNNNDYKNLKLKAINNKSIKNYEEINDMENNCRICFSNDSTDENPILRLCNCHSYTHYKCLKFYLKNYINISENANSTVISYFCNRFNCEICGEPYPLRFKIKFDEHKEAKNYYLIDGLKLPEETNYIILESLTYLSERNRNQKNIYVVKLTGDDITIGRNNLNDIIDDDLSISRFHAILKFNKETGNITLLNKGKFGSLVLIKNNIKLTNNEKIYLQVGNIFIIVEQKENNEDNNPQ